MWEVHAVIKADNIYEESQLEEQLSDFFPIVSEKYSWTVSVDEEEAVTYVTIDMNIVFDNSHIFEACLQQYFKQFLLISWEVISSLAISGDIQMSFKSTPQTNKSEKKKEVKQFSQIFRHTFNLLENPEFLNKQKSLKAEEMFLKYFDISPREMLQVHEYVIEKLLKDNKSEYAIEVARISREIETLWVKYKEYQEEFKQLDRKDLDNTHIVVLLQKIKGISFKIMLLRQAYAEITEKAVNADLDLHGEEYINDCISNRSGRLFDISKQFFLKGLEDSTFEEKILKDIHQQLLEQAPIIPPVYDIHKKVPQRLEAEGLKEKYLQVDSDMIEEKRIIFHHKYTSQPVEFYQVSLGKMRNAHYRLSDEDKQQLKSLLQEMEEEEAFQLAQYIFDYSTVSRIYPELLQTKKRSQFTGKDIIQQTTPPTAETSKQFLCSFLDEELLKKYQKVLDETVFEYLDDLNITQTSVSQLQANPSKTVFSCKILPQFDKDIQEKMDSFQDRNDVILPDVSWGDPLTSGVKCIKKLPNVEMSYVPQNFRREYFQARKKIKNNLFTIKHTLNKKEIHTAVKSFREKEINRLSFSPESFVKQGNKILELKNIFSIEDLASYDIAHYMTKEEIEVLITTGQEGIIVDKTRNLSKGKISLPNKQDLLEAGYIQVENSYDEKWISQQDLERAEKSAQKAEKLLTQFEGKVFTDQMKVDVEEWQRDWDMERKNNNEFFENEIKFLFDQNIKEALKIEMKKQDDSDFARSLLTEIDHLLIDYDQVHIKDKVIQTEINPITEAPLNDQGLLRVEADDAKQALEALHKLGITQSTDLPHVPEVYQTSPLISSDFLKPHQELITPPGKLPVHGITVQHSNFLFQKHALSNSINNIIRSGGLLSTSARRQRGLTIQTTSPGGDIASGIDHGVGFTIGKRPYIGNDIIIVAHPHILKRKELFFSPKDFGGGHNRFDKYNSYAQELGVSSIYDDVPVDMRKKHLLHNTDNRTNEIFLKDKLGLDEMLAWLVDDELFDEVEEKIKVYQRQGLVPKSLKILKNTGEVEQMIQRLWLQVFS